ncbi:ComEA family DNA-binding protein [Flavobacterium sp. SM2513]|uniref:ComEA family DNA-binding protein n=1 Tax=Flavobacterium sp. SM2513 TaxID=3424766 RepID=UPI003D7FCBA5
MKKESKYFFQKFSPSQRIGLLTLFVLIIGFQLFYHFSPSSVQDEPLKEKEEWLAFQTKMDSLKEFKTEYKYKVYPYNPNFITDYKGSKLGMSVAELDRLFAFRKENKYVNSAKEFQQVTKVSDSLLKEMAVYFKFPDWVNQKREYSSKYTPFAKKEKEVIVVKDINHATAEDLIKIRGIGEAISARILKERDKFGAFASMEQMQFIWGLSPEVIDYLNQYFKVVDVSQMKKININDATLKQLSAFPFFNYTLSREILIYRSMNTKIKDAEDLTKIKGFPVEKVSVIALYLEF